MTEDRRKSKRMRVIVDFARDAINQGGSKREAADLLRMEFVPLHVALRVLAGRVIDLPSDSPAESAAFG